MENEMKLRKIAAAVLLLCLCLPLMACAAEKNSRDAVSLWYVEGEAAAPALAALIGEYNAGLDGELLPLSLRAFPDEESLAAAFDTARPDLLLCAHPRAMALYDRGLTRDTAPALAGNPPAFAAWLTERFSAVGRSFFPIGTEVQLLYARSGSLGREAPEDLEALLSRAGAYGLENRAPFLTADSFAALFYQSLLSQGSEFHGLESLDIRDENYKRSYNLIAAAAYNEGLEALNYPGAALVQGGYLPCALTPSSALAGAETKGFEILPLPVSGRRLGETLGLAVTAPEGRGLRSAAAFLGWLMESGRASKLAYDSGLVPAAGERAEGDSPLAAVLAALWDAGALHLPDPDCDYYVNRVAFEASFRAALKRFY